MSDKKRASEGKGNKKKENQNQCPICLERITNRCRTDPCNHEFCYNCLHHWSNDHNFCPICRRVFDQIIYNIRDDSHYDSIPVENQQNRVRGNLLQQRSALRQTLIEGRTQVNQHLQTLRQRIGETEGFRNRIDEHLTQINSIDRQNNDEIQQMLNRAQNTINEINSSNQMSPIGGLHTNLNSPSMLSILRPILFDHNFMNALTSSSDLMTGNLTNNSGNGSSEGSSSEDTSNSVSSQSPSTVTYRIYGPNSVGSVSVSSSDNNNSSVRSIRSTVIRSQSNNDLRQMNNNSLLSLLSESPLSRGDNNQIEGGIRSSHNLSQFYHQMNNEFGRMNDELEQMNHFMPHAFGKDNLSWHTSFPQSRVWQYRGRGRSGYGRDRGSGGRPLFRSNALQRNMNSLGQHNRRHSYESDTQTNQNNWDSDWETDFDSEFE